MLVVGESVYKDCEQKVGIADGIVLSCPFKGENRPRSTWCRPCLLAKIRSLEQAMASLAERATAEAVSKY